jgi:hypothetical protein
MKLLIMQSSSASNHFLPLGLKYLPHQPFLKHLEKSLSKFKYCMGTERHVNLLFSLMLVAHEVVGHLPGTCKLVSVL